MSDEVQVAAPTAEAPAASAPSGMDAAIALLLEGGPAAEATESPTSAAEGAVDADVPAVSEDVATVTPEASGEVIKGAPKPAATAALEQQLADLKAQIAQLAAPKQETKPAASDADLAELAAWRKVKDLAPRDFQAVLDHLGMTPEDIVRQAKNGGKLTPEQIEQQELKARLDKFEKADQEKYAAAQREQHAANERAFTDQLRQAAAASKDHDLVRNFGEDGVQAVKSVIEQHFLRTQKQSGVGEELTFKQAADIVESHYDRMVDEKLSKSEKVKRKLSAGSAAHVTLKPSTAPKTITGAMTGQAKAPTGGYDQKAAMAAAMKLLTSK